MTARPSAFLDGPLPAIYAKTALPIIFVMAMNGALAVVDALYLGHYVGAPALAAVTLMFPVYMAIVSAATLISGGMSSLLARRLGAGDRQAAGQVYAAAHGLGLVAAAILNGLFLAFGPALALLATAGDPVLAEMGATYLRITVWLTPLMFVLSVNSDALRNEGRVPLMAGLSLAVVLLNMGFNWLFIGGLGWGVAGSAWGTGAAQGVAFITLLALRLRGAAILHPREALTPAPAALWGRILALGAPQSLNFIGIALGSGAIVAAIQIAGAPGFADTASAYGIVTRVLTFAYLPLLGLTHAMQSITGANFGAGALDRSDRSVGIALVLALAYSATVQGVLWALAPVIGGLFVDDPAVVAEVARILPPIVAGFVLAGPMMIVASYFQALGEATRAAILSLAKPYLFAIPLTFLLLALLGERGIWLAAPAAEALLAILAVPVLIQRAGSRNARWGLFLARAGAADKPRVDGTPIAADTEPPEVRAGS